MFKIGTQASSDRLQLEYNFHATRNNGNLVGQTIVQPGRTWTQSYTYDALNRLSTAEETPSGTGSGWSRGYGYDRYGNRWVASSSGVLTESHEPTSSSNFSASNNRLSVQSSAFDNAGNQTFYSPFNLTYDAESRMVEAVDPAFPATHSSSYAYDGDGRRVKKIVVGGSFTTTTYFVYNALGQLAAEYSTQAATPVTTYIHTDMLGSTRMVSNASGTILECYD